MQLIIIEKRQDWRDLGLRDLWAYRELLITSGSIIQDWLQDAFTLTVTEGDFFGTGRVPPASHAGLLLLDQAWTVAPATVP